MPAFAAERIPDESLRTLASFVLSLRVSRPSAAAPVSRGAGIFRGKGKCLDCHRVNGEGSAAAPDLSEIGRQRDPDWIRRAILAPESALYDSFAGYRWTIHIPDNYLLVEAVTASGETVAGGRLNEDAFSIQIRDREGRIRSFLKSDLRALRKQWGKSPMPSYKDVLSRDEVDQLVGYLSGLRGLR
jgi:putative heme-binding domain-containing protein